ncbi:MAG: CRISPR-associated helicase Cas3' [Anaerolineae bacterium]|nr:CRISPR-associated helicase Cas3' [Anaerolineae bacterium]
MAELSRILARPKERLTTHSLRVLARVEQLATLRPLPEYPRLWQRLAYAALLHDGGKLAPGFQRGLRSRRERWGLRHEVLSLAFVQWFDFGGDLPWVIAAIATHHRDAAFILERYRPRSNPTDDRAVQLLDGLDPAAAHAWYDWLVGAFAELQEPPRIRPFALPTPDVIHKALSYFETWLTPLHEQGAAHPDYVQAIMLRGGMILADHAASAQTRDFTPLNLDARRIWERIGPAPFAHQPRCAALAGRPALLVAPTGSGKTEAALLWAAQAPAARLLYLLPYRASMDAMQRRLENVAPAEDVGLQHGRALQSLYRRLLDEHHAPPDAARDATERLNVARLHAYPIRVTSPYQLLRAAYQFKGFEATLADMHAALLIVDEIHAYDPARLAMIVETLGFLRRHITIRPLIMTATLPPLVQAALCEALPELHMLRASARTFADFRRHVVRLRPGDLADDLDAIVAARRTGQAVLVTVNTVRRARAIGGALNALGIETHVLHSRFSARDRWDHERELLRLFGVGAHPTEASQPRPIVVATQVIEVSLDLSFDTLFSDPAPLEALVQRFGRVNRKPNPAALAPVHVYDQPTGRADRRPVYDPALVEAGLDVLRGWDGQPVDEARVSAGLAQVYRGAIAEGWRARYTAKQTEFRRAVLDDLRPFQSADEGLFRAFSAHFDGVEVLPLDLEDEYRATLNNDPIGASTLLVPLAWWQYVMLQDQGRAWQGEGDDLFFVDAPYDALTGLQLENDEAE